MEIVPNREGACKKLQRRQIAWPCWGQTWAREEWKEIRMKGNKGGFHIRKVARLTKWYYTTGATSNWVFQHQCLVVATWLCASLHPLFRKLQMFSMAAFFIVVFIVSSPPGCQSFLFEVEPEKPLRQWDFQHLSPTSLRWSCFLILGTFCISSFSSVLGGAKQPGHPSLLTHPTGFLVQLGENYWVHTILLSRLYQGTQ